MGIGLVISSDFSHTCSLHVDMLPSQSRIPVPLSAAVKLYVEQEEQVCGEEGLFDEAEDLADAAARAWPE